VGPRPFLILLDVARRPTHRIVGLVHDINTQCVDSGRTAQTLCSSIFAALDSCGRP
jgi:hypothetical protein